MFSKTLKFAGLQLACLFFYFPVQSQVLTFKNALDTALKNYALLKAKQKYVQASVANVEQQRRMAVPDISIGAQQSFGTINNINGPGIGISGLNVASSGPVMPSQNWAAAFGSLYLANINWNFFTFGRIHEGIEVARTNMQLQQMDLNQETFQHEVRVASAYLNLLAAQQLTISQQHNLDRAIAIRAAVIPRVKNGLNPGVDSSFANAEVSNARIALTYARNTEQQQANQLVYYLGISPADPLLDTLFVTQLPRAFLDTSATVTNQHPVLQYYQGRINYSQEQEKYIHTQYYPTLSLIGVLQGRGSGFGANYGVNAPDDYSHNYFKSIGATKDNYLVGISASWDLTTPFRLKKQAEAQHITTEAYRDEYELANQQLTDQMALSYSKIRNALSNYREAPIQVQAAEDGYIQKTTLYRNGLATIVDVTQALYALNRAETDRDIAFNNVWQALLIKAASAGDFNIFLNEF